MSYNYGGSKKNIVNLEKQNIGFYDHRLVNIVNIVHSYSILIILSGQPVAAESIQILSRLSPCLDAKHEASPCIL